MAGEIKYLYGLVGTYVLLYAYQYHLLKKATDSIENKEVRTDMEKKNTKFRIASVLVTIPLVMFVKSKLFPKQEIEEFATL